jgi:monothiol glutaredoxin
MARVRRHTVRVVGPGGSPGAPIPDRRRAMPDHPPVHPDAAAARERFHADVVAEVAHAVATHPLVVIGMAWNVPVRRARALLVQKEIPFHGLTYGNYVVGWKKRLAIKLWSGWPTFPQVFVHGVLVGGASDLARLVEGGELGRLLDAGRA